MSNSPWFYNGEIIDENYDLSEYVGFVYKITNLIDGRFYVGKKSLTRRSSKKVKGRKRKITVSSDWMKYYGSSDDLKKDVAELGESSFKREILMLCKTKSEMSYYEAKNQFDMGVLLDRKSVV